MLISTHNKEINSNRKGLIERMTMLYGEHSPITLDFIKLCHNWCEGEAWDECLALLVQAHEEDPQTLEF